MTINLATTKEDGITSVGDHCYLMACCHVAHDCRIGDRVIMANGTLLGGHVHVHDDATLSGGVGVHHFATIGSFSFVSGLSRVLHDVPPFMLVEGSPARPRCVNVVALQAAPVSGRNHRRPGRSPPAALPRQSRPGPCPRDPPQQRQAGAGGQSSAEFRAEPARRPPRPGPGAKESRVKPLRLAVIGAGHLGRIHARLLRSIAGVELVGSRRSAV